MQANSQPDNKELFGQAYRRLCTKKGLPKELEEAVWLHVVAVKCDQPEKFLEGIKTFGFEIE